MNRFKNATTGLGFSLNLTWQEINLLNEITNGTMPKSTIIESYGSQAVGRLQKMGLLYRGEVKRTPAGRKVCDLLQIAEVM
jgi:hypothetical protein